MKTRFGFLIMFIVLLVVLASADPSKVYAETIEKVKVSADYNQTAARSMLKMVNSFRTGSEAWAWNSSNTQKVRYTNLSKLTYDYQLEQIAMQRAIEVALYFDHVRPNGKSCFTAYSAAGYTYSSAGENIAAGFATAQSAFNIWKEDDDYYSGQGHRRAMLNKNYNRIGIACVELNGICYWVQEFAASNESNTTTTAFNGTKSITVKLNMSLTDVKIRCSEESFNIKVGKPVSGPSAATYIRMREGWPYEQWSKVKGTITYSIGNTDIAVVSEGKIVGVKPGKTTITIKSLGKSVKIPLVVTKI